MTGLLLCALAFLTCLLLTVLNWNAGLVLLVSWGYAFGILKAHFVQSSGHFIFDAATVGFYAGIIIKFPDQQERNRWNRVFPWTIFLIGWPIFIALVPLQHWMVQLIGLRGNIFWVPMLLIGARMDREGQFVFSNSLACLNIFVFSIALGEYFLGVEFFVPQNEVTEIVFNSNDIAGGHTRIPSTFTNAHSYAGAMVASVPWIFGALLDKKNLNFLGATGSVVLVIGLICGLLGVFIAGPRLPVIVLGFLLLATLLVGKTSFGFIFVLLIAGSVVGYFVYQNERLQRFTDLQSIEKVQERLGVSLNSTLMDIFLEYPMGNGMGAGGTSLPFFAQGLVSRPIIMENEFARIILEQGIPGLVIFCVFYFWLLSCRVVKNDPAGFTKVMLWAFAVASISIAWIGIGLMSTIPTTALMFLGIGFFLRSECQSRLQLLPDIVVKSRYEWLPAYQRGLSKA